MSGFARNTAATLATKAGALLLGMVSSVILARLLEPDGMGVYSLALLVPALVTTFGNLGVGPSTVFQVAGGGYAPREVFGNNALLGLTLGIAGFAAGAAGVMLFGERWLPGLPPSYALLALVIVLPTLLASGQESLLLGLQRVRDYNLSALGVVAAKVVLVAIALWGLRAGVPGALWAVVLASLAHATGLFAWVWRVVGKPEWRPNRDYMKATARYGAQAHLANVIQFLNYRLDMFLVNGFLGATALGFYFLAVSLVEKLSILPGAASAILLPKVAAESDEEARREFTPIVCRIVLAVTAVAAVALYLVSQWLITTLYSGDYAPSVRPLQILLIGIVALSALEVLAHDMAGRGRPSLNTGLAGLALAVNVPLNLIMIPRWGIEGAAWATSIAYVLETAIGVVVYCRLSGNTPRKVLVLEKADWALAKRIAARARQAAAGGEAG